MIEPNGTPCLCEHDYDVLCGNKADRLCSCCDSPICQRCMDVCPKQDEDTSKGEDLDA